MSRKYLLLYGPLLWIRKVVVYLLVTAIVTGLTLYFLANSPWVIKKVANAFAPDYNITYSRIYGNVLTGIEIDDLAYNEDLVAKHMTLKWNPNGLVKKHLIVNVLQIEKANVDTIRRLIDAFSGSDDNESHETNGESSTFNLAVDIGHASVTLEPFIQQGIGISRAALDIKEIAYKEKNLNVGSLVLQVDSNITDLIFNANVKANHLAGQLKLMPRKSAFETYALPFRHEAIGDIVIALQATTEQIQAELDMKMEQLLKGHADDFNLDIESLRSHLLYEIKSGVMKIDTKAIVNTPYAKDIVVTNLFMRDDKIGYNGEIHAKQILGVDAKWGKLLKDLQVKYDGDMQSIRSEILSANLQGAFTSPDFKTALLHLENKEALLLNEMVDLPAELNQTKANIVIDAPIHFDENLSMRATAKIDSNVMNVDMNITYEEKLSIKAISYIPEASLLRIYSEKVKWDRLSPMVSEFKLQENRIDAEMRADAIDVNAQYELNTTQVTGKVSLGSLHVDVSGRVDEKMMVDTKITSIQSLIKSMKHIYSLEDVPSIQGKGDISIELDEMKNVHVRLTSPKIIYQSDRTKEHHVNDIDLALSVKDQNVVLNRYTLTFAGQKLFSTKPSILSFDDTNVTIDPLWINDALKVVGTYDLKAKKGTIDADGQKLHIVHEIVDLKSNIDLKTLLDGNKTSVNGEITLLGGNIHYDLGQKTYASDSDIIIVQDIKEKEATPFMDNLSGLVQIKTAKPLVYKKGSVDVKAEVDLSVYKAEGSEMMVLGSVEILKGSSYTFEGKKFVLDTSYVHFTGNPNKPLLEGSATYQSLDHLITIMVTGSAHTPHIHFSSKPSLSKEQILSIILFDSTEGAGTNSGEDMMKMMGGAIAKSALSDLGVQLDHLVLGQGSIEVGKKLTDEITIIYVNDEVSSVKLKYRHGRRTESVISVSEESQSYDIIYKRDF